MKPQTVFAITAMLAIFSCNQKQDISSPSFAPEIVVAHGYVVPEDSIGNPQVVSVSIDSKVSTAGVIRKPLTNSNERLALKLKVVPAAIPKICTPGKDGYSSPKPVPTTGRTVNAGIPQIVLVKEASTTDNPQNFSSFGKLQGLKSNSITCLLEDKSGNLWIGTRKNGVSKYDGKSFTHFTIKEGLGSDYTSHIQEDKNGNLWISNFGYGVSKYDGRNFTHITKTEGLSHNNVWSMVLDGSGHLWLGTGAGGVDIYDGKSIRHFTEKEGFTNNLVASMMVDKNGNIWFGRYGGVSKYDGKSFTHLNERDLVDDRVISILEDKSGDMWFGTVDGVSKYDGKSFTHFTKKDGLNDVVTAMLQDKNGDIWFGTMKNGLVKYDGQKFTWYNYKEGLNNSYVRCIMQDKRGNLWIGTDGGGVNIYNGKRFTHYSKDEGLFNNDISSILEDKSGNIWIGMFDEGVMIYDGQNFNHLTGMADNSVTSMLEDKSGNFWLCHFYHVDIFDGKSFTRFKLPEGPHSPTCIMQDKKENIWLGTYGGGVFKYDGKTLTHITEKEGLSHNIVRSIVEDNNGFLWFGTHGGGITNYNGIKFTRFTKKEGLKDNYIVSTFVDRSGQLWIGSLNGGVSKYDGKTFIHFTEKDGLSSNNVKCIMEDEGGSLWFGTETGLSKLSKDKLDIIHKYSADRISTSRYTGLHFKNYTYEDGFWGISVTTDKTMLQSRNGTIWIGAGRTLTAYHPGEEMPDTIAPNVQITGVTLYDENVAWQNLLSHQPEGERRVKDTSILLGNGVTVHDVHFDEVKKWYGFPERLSLPYDNNFLTFKFVGITIASPQKVKYQYKLEGLDQNWSALTSRSEANYGNLPHGKYTFVVKAINGDGYWSNEYNYTFTIRPPWWHTWWAYTLFALSTTGIVYVLFRYRLNQVQMKHQIELQKHKTSALEIESRQALLYERLRISRELHDDIGSTLGSISIYSAVAKKRTQKKENTDEVLSKIGLVARELIDKMSDIIWSLNPNHESFEQLQNRMTTFAGMILAPRNIQYEFNAEEEVKNIQFTPGQRKDLFLIFKEALYNIAKYADCKNVSVSLCGRNNNFIMIIKDDGKGFDVSSDTTNKPLSTGEFSGGNGINNMKARAHDMKATLCIHSKMNEGTTVRLKLYL